MNFWFFFTLGFVFISVFKGYISRGVYQATASKIVRLVYTFYQELNQYLYVNRGFGFMGFAGRIGIVPEITIFTLKRK